MIGWTLFVVFVWVIAPVLKALFWPVIKELWKWLKWEWWFWQSPNIPLLRYHGLDRETIEVIFEQWLEREPK